MIGKADLDNMMLMKLTILSSKLVETERVRQAESQQAIHHGLKVTASEILY